MTPWELGITLALGGLAQGLVLVTMMSLYLKRSSLGSRLEALRGEVAERDRSLRQWVRDGWAQLEADSRDRDAKLHEELLTGRKMFREIVQEVIRSKETADALAEPIGAHLISKLLDSKAVRREVAAMEQLGAAIRSGRVRLDKEEPMAHRVWATGEGMAGTFSVTDVGDDYVEVISGSVKLSAAAGTVHFRVSTTAPPPPDAETGDPTLSPTGNTFVATRYVALKGPGTVNYVAKP